MPDATDTYSIDYYWYQYIINPIANKICFISPNTITFIGAVLIIPIIRNLLTNGRLSTFIILMSIRYFLDCLDGAIARKCDKKSEFGAAFDILSDSFLICSLNLIIIYYILRYKTCKSYDNYCTLILLSLLLFTICLFHNLLDSTHTSNDPFYGSIDRFVHDNGVFFFPLYAYLIKSFGLIVIK